MLPSNGDKSLGVVQNEGIGELSLISPLRRPGRRKPEERCRPGSRTQSYTFLYNCVLSRNIIPSSHPSLALRVAFCDPVRSAGARTPTPGLGNLLAKRLRRTFSADAIMPSRVCPQIRPAAHTSSRHGSTGAWLWLGSCFSVPPNWCYQSFKKARQLSWNVGGTVPMYHNDRDGSNQY